jgi:hypothetical protein
MLPMLPLLCESDVLVKTKRRSHEAGALPHLRWGVLDQQQPLASWRVHGAAAGNAGGRLPRRRQRGVHLPEGRWYPSGFDRHGATGDLGLVSYLPGVQRCASAASSLGGGLAAAARLAVNLPLSKRSTAPFAS